MCKEKVGELEKKRRESDSKFIRLYEDLSKKLITEEQLRMLSAYFEQEKKEYTEEIEKPNAMAENLEDGSVDFNQLRDKLQVVDANGKVCLVEYQYKLDAENTDTVKKEEVSPEPPEPEKEEKASEPPEPGDNETERGVHRDIKPDNLFYSQSENRFKLGDFGIAHYLSRPTQGKGRAGTLTHMSPEIYRGAEFTSAGDRYALGMILYRLLNDNRIPFLPLYPESFTPAMRDEAMVKRLRIRKNASHLQENSGKRWRAYNKFS